MFKDVSCKKKQDLIPKKLAIKILLIVILSTGIQTRSTDHSKKIIFPKHVENYDDLLIWAIKFGFPEFIEKYQNFHNVEHFHHNQESNFLQENYENQETLESLAKQFAEEENLIFLGQVGEITGVFLFAVGLQFKDDTKKTSETQNLQDNGTHILNDSSTLEEFIAKHSEIFDKNIVTNVLERKFDENVNIVWHSQQKVTSRQKRCRHQPHFQDPYFKEQWHLCNKIHDSMDIDVVEVWHRNITGSGVTVAVVDDGLEWTNPDLKENYNAEGSWDLNSNDPDPTPDGGKETNHHGTRCAGEIAAGRNSVCGVGVAYGAKVAGVRVLDGPMTDSLEAAAFNKNFQINDIYSCSWGPDDDGRTVDGPHILAKAAMRYGINYGRGGYGNIYVVASGNGGRNGDNCNYDGYANSLYTVTIGAVDETGHMPYYAEECASMLAVTFSSGSLLRSIVTTDWTLNGAEGCTRRHSGTSAAAPIAAGMVALMLQVRPCLTWRDVQYLIAMTALKVDVDIAHWQKNGAGLFHSHKHGFGLMKAWRLVNAAKVWQMVPWLTSFTHRSTNIDIKIPKSSRKPLVIRHTVEESAIKGYDLYIMEHVQLRVTITHPRRGLLEIQLVCPSGTRSVIASPRSLDNSTAGYADWTFSTVRCWGEKPTGEWKIIITDTDVLNLGFGYLNSWQLILYGTPMTPEDFHSRLKLIRKAMSGEFLNANYSLPCPGPPVKAKPYTPVSEKTLKMITLVGIFLFIMGVYESLESLLCYNKEKKEHARRMGLTNSARHLMRRNTSDHNQDFSESRALLQEEEHIPLDDLSANHNTAMNDYEILSHDAGVISQEAQGTFTYANEDEEILKYEKVKDGLRYANKEGYVQKDDCDNNDDDDDDDDDDDIDLNSEQSKLLTR